MSQRTTYPNAMRTTENLVILGAQWGDESKGKLTDVFAEHADVVARYQGGDNAGHTIVLGDKTFILHLIPSGILRPKTTNVIGNGVVVNVETLFGEIDRLEAQGIAVSSENLKISDRAHLILPYHKAVEHWEQMGSGTKIGTTARGIGPTYADKMNRHAGIRVGDLLEFERFQQKLDYNLDTKAHALQTNFPVGAVSNRADLLDTYRGYAERIAPYVTDTVAFMHDALAAGKRILFEGAQGTMLDIDFGTYPYVTSSNCTAGAVCTGLGIGPKAIEKVMGVSKAYVTRVGGGPFPTEMAPDLDEKIRDIGQEYGATTQRPRRCGWLDLVALRYATRINGFTAIAMTKLDVFDTLDELLVCVAYRYQGREMTTFPSSLQVLEECEPIYETLPGWQQPLTEARASEDIPSRTRDYVAYVAAYLNVPIPIISVGPDREQIVTLDASHLNFQ